MKKNFSSNDIQQWLKQYDTNTVPAIADIYVKENTHNGKFFVRNTAHTHALPPMQVSRARKAVTQMQASSQHSSSIPLYEQSVEATTAFKESKRISQRVLEEERSLLQAQKRQKQFHDTLKRSVQELRRMIFTTKALDEHLDKSDLQITKLEFSVTYMCEQLTVKEDSYENYAEILREIAVQKRKKQYASSAYLLPERKASSTSEHLQQPLSADLSDSSFNGPE